MPIRDIRGFRQAACVGNIESIQSYLKTASDKAKQHALSSAIIAGNLTSVTQLLIAGTLVTSEQVVYAAEMNHVRVLNALLPYVVHVDAVKQGGFTALMWAARHNNLEMTISLLEKEPDLNKRNDKGLSALYFSVSRGFMDVANLLVLFGASAKGNEELQRIFVDAASVGNMQAIQLLINAGINVNEKRFKNKNSDFALIAATIGSHVEVVVTLIDIGADVNQTTPRGRTSLMEAASNGHETLVRTLLENGSDVNKSSKNRMTAIMFAARMGHYHLIRVLIDHGANLGLITKWCTTTLDIAIYHGHFNIAGILIDAGARINPALQHTGALVRAIKTDEEKVVSALLAADIGVNEPNGFGEYPIHHAVKNADIAQLLCRAGANVQVCNQEGSSLLARAAMENNADVIHVLMKYGAKSEVRDRNGLTPVMIAAMHGNDAALAALLKEGANQHATDRNGSTALDLIKMSDDIDRKRREVAETLIAWGTECRDFKRVVNNILGGAGVRKRMCDIR